MKKSDLIWAMLDVDEDLIRLAEEEPVMTKKYTRPLRTLLVAAVIAALLAGTVLAAYAVRHWDEGLAQFFHVEDEQKALLDGTLQDVYATAEQNGVTVTLKQLLGDEHCMVATLEITLPEDLELGAISAENLRPLAEEHGYVWEDADSMAAVTTQLRKWYDYDADRTDFPDAPYMDDATIYPIQVDSEELQNMVAAKLEEYPGMDADGATGFSLYDRAQEELGDDFDSMGSGILKRSYDPETRTLTALIVTECSTSMQGRPCTLLLDHLWLHKMQDRYTISGKELLGQEQDLLDMPLLLNFTADYEVISQTYDILQDGEPVGTLKLSPVSAYITFPLEPDDTVYSSFEQAALAPNRQDFLMEHPNRSLIAVMEDGREIPLDWQTSGETDVQSAFYLTTDIIDLNQVQEVQYEGYTTQPRKGG